MKKDILNQIAQSNKQKQQSKITIGEYLELCKTDPYAYATPAQRLKKAIGEPVLFDTLKDSRLSSIFGGKILKIYPTLKDFYGVETDMESVVSFVDSAAMGLEEENQVLFILGDVGSGKSTLANRLKELMENEPLYVLAAEDGTISPVFDNPLALFIQHKELMLEEYGIKARYFPTVLSGWAVKRLAEYDGDITKFKVVKVYPSAERKMCIAKTESLDDNNADISTLIGKLNLRQLQYFNANDADAYLYSGALCYGNRGIVEMAEMYKANTKTLNPLLEATQSHSFNGLEQIGALPFNGLIISHSNKSEWEKFRTNKDNEAMLDRIVVIKFHYNLRVDEEIMILKKGLAKGELLDKNLVPDTLEILAKFTILTRLEPLTISNPYSKMRVYNGENIKNEDNRALPYRDYKNKATQEEGLFGIGPRKSLKILSKVFNYNTEEIGADPITLFMILKDEIVKAQYDKNTEADYLSYLSVYLEPKYVDELGKQIQRAYIESFGSYAQAKFDRYYEMSAQWINNGDYEDPVTGVRMDKDALDKELSIIEKEAGIGDPKDFRQEIVFYILSQKSKGVTVQWNSYKKLAEKIEASVFKSMKDILPIISYGAKTNKKDEAEHAKFVDNMMKIGYTSRQVQNLVNYYIQKLNS